MNRLTHRARAAAVLAALTLAAMTVAAPFAAAATAAAPFKDANVVGSLTFCSRTGQPITSGSLNTMPFAWKTVSSSPAPALYRGATGRATLAAYQPLKYVDPGDWSGGQLTGSSSFTNSGHPVVQATNGDSPLLGFVQSYPPHWQGLVEIRMIFSGNNLPQHIAPYPAAVVRVSGSSWTLVSGGGSSCSASKGVSDETKLLPKKRLAHPRVLVPAGSSSNAATKAGNSSAKSSGASSTSGSSRSSSADGSANLAAESTPTGTSTGTKTGVALAVIGLTALAATAIFWWRRRPTGGQ